MCWRRCQVQSLRDLERVHSNSRACWDPLFISTSLGCFSAWPALSFQPARHVLLTGAYAFDWLPLACVSSRGHPPVRLRRFNRCESDACGDPGLETRGFNRPHQKYDHSVVAGKLRRPQAGFGLNYQACGTCGFGEVTP